MCSKAVAWLLPDAIARLEVIAAFAVFLIVLAAVTGLMVLVFLRR